jgi:hypothetical protein
MHQVARNRRRFVKETNLSETLIGDCRLVCCQETLFSFTAEAGLCDEMLHQPQAYAICKLQGQIATIRCSMLFRSTQRYQLCCRTRHGHGPMLL